MKRDWYSILGWVAMVAVPVAPAFYFGFEFATDVHGRMMQSWPAAALVAALIVGVVSAAGLELVGILSGHNAVRFWNRGDGVKATICAIVLIAYVSLGISGLESFLSKGVVMFLVAPLVYLLVAMQKTLEAVEEQEQTAARDDIAWQRRQETEQARREHELALTRLESERQERIAQAEAKAHTDAEKAKQAAAVKVAKERVKIEQLRLEQSQQERQQVAEQVAEQAVERRSELQEQTEQVAEQFECEDCGQMFGTINARNAHMRWCAGSEPVESKVNANGRTKEQP